jgi:hypothetical protein
MLAKGQLAKSVALQHEANKKSVRALFTLLRKADVSTSRISTLLSDACENQQRLAELTILEHGVHRMSLNTLKSVANIVIEDGGWKKIDELRRRIRFRRANHSRRVKSRLQRRINKLSEMNSKLEEAFRIRSVMNRAYFDAISILRSQATNDTIIRQKLERHFATYGDAMGIRIVDGEQRDAH